MRKEVIILALALVILSNAVSANFAPVIENLDDKILVCESSQFSLEFEVAELEGETLSAGISPSGPFFIRQISSDAPITKFELFSTNLTKLFSDKLYNHSVFVTDGQLIDTKQLEIIVLETNNPPQIEHLSVQTIELNKSEEFTKEIKFSDQESKNLPRNKFSFSVSDSSNLLEMSVDNQGVLHYKPSESHLGVHEVTVCATDTGVDDLDRKIGLCTPDEIESTSCKTFELSITNSNSPPTILATNSSTNSTRIAGTQKLSFTIFKYDPDKIFPDTYWYVDNKLKQIDFGKSSDNFHYSFGCGAFGRHKIKAVITDGLLNDSTEWTYDVINTACPEGILPREKVGDSMCEEKWGCFEWGLCQNAIQSKDIGVLKIAEYEDLKQRCDVRGLDEKTCGYQTRTCMDVNDCNTIQKKPLELIPCHFSLEPSCSDGIQNCHDGGCEFLVDCGGPCSACATCSDRILNQGEEKIDCGGPCSKKCEWKDYGSSSDENIFIKQSMLYAILVAMVIAVIQILRIIRNKNKLEEQPKKELVVAYE